MSLLPVYLCLVKHLLIIRCYVGNMNSEYCWTSIDSIIADSWCFMKNGPLHYPLNLWWQKIDITTSKYEILSSVYDWSPIFQFKKRYFFSVFFYTCTIWAYQKLIWWYHDNLQEDFFISVFLKSEHCFNICV